MAYLRQLITPQQITMGSVGSDPIHASCADCGTKDAMIQGFLSSAGADREHTHNDLILLPAEDSTFFKKPAYFCVDCFAKRVAQAAA